MLPMPDDAAIEAEVIRYIKSALERGDFPTRFEAVRDITGRLPVLPSAVGRIVDGMVKSGVLKMRADGQLSIPPAPAPSA
jgi:hypothetical protein